MAFRPPPLPAMMGGHVVERVRRPIGDVVVHTMKSRRTSRAPRMGRGPAAASSCAALSLVSGEALASLALLELLAAAAKTVAVGVCSNEGGSSMGLGFVGT